MNTYKGIITKLEQYDIFVFGSNLKGFHGAGSAGYASFGVFGNKWRDFDYASKPNGWRGRWNVKGIGEGLQQGTEGWSYALPTVVKAGLKRSRNVKEIINSISKLYQCALNNSNWRFLVAYSVKPSLNGYTPIEMAHMFLIAGKIPNNIYFNEDFSKLIT